MTRWLFRLPTTTIVQKISYGTKNSNLSEREENFFIKFLSETLQQRQEQYATCAIVFFYIILR